MMFQILHANLTNHDIFSCIAVERNIVKHCLNVDYRLQKTVYNTQCTMNLSQLNLYSGIGQSLLTIWAIYVCRRCQSPFREGILRKICCSFGFCPIYPRARFAGAQFAVAQFAGAQFAAPGVQFVGAQFAEAQFAAKITSIQICPEPLKKLTWFAFFAKHCTN